jgi:hypothetical protein
MPGLTDPTLWRSKGYSVRPRVVVVKPSVILACRVNQASFTYPFSLITFDTVTAGAYTDVKAGMTVLLGSSAGASDRGRTYVRSITSTQITIPRTSRGRVDGTLDPADNLYITILNLHAPHSKNPYIDPTGNIYKDNDIAVGTRTTNPPPVANGGMGYAGYVDGTNHLTLDFNANSSFVLAPGATITGYAWNFMDATPSSSTSSTPTAIVFPAGFRYIYLTVTDSNGNTHTKSIPIYAATTTGTYAPIVGASLTTYSRKPPGSVLSIDFAQSMLTTDYPDGSLVMVWLEEYYDGVLSYAGGVTNRQPMFFIGWHRKTDHKTKVTEKGSYTVMSWECWDIGSYLQVLPGYPQRLLNTSVPSTWYEYDRLNIDKYLVYLLYWHSNALELADYVNPGFGSTYPITTLASDGSSLYDQVDKRAQAIACRFTCNRWGQFQIVRDPQLFDTADRTSDVQIALGTSDWKEVTFTEERPPRTHWGRESAVLIGTCDGNDASCIDAVFSIAPGSAPSQGAAEATIGEQLVQNQLELNKRAGHRYARSNAPYGYINLALSRAGEIGIDPADFIWVTLTTLTDKRGNVLTTSRALPIEFASTFSADGKRYNRLVVELETVGQPGETVEREISLTLDPYLNNDPDILNPIDGLVSDDYLINTPTDGELYLLNRGIGRMAMVDDAGNLFRTDDWSTSEGDGGPTWTQTTLSISGTPVQWVPDAFCSKYRGTGTNVAGWLITSTHIYKLSDIFGTPTLTDQLTFRSATLYRSADANFAAFGKVFVASTYDDGVYLTDTTDGSAWSTETLDGTATNSGIPGPFHDIMDFTTSDYDFFADYPYPNVINNAFWTSGTGWEIPMPGGGDDRPLGAISKRFTQTHIHTLSLDYYCPRDSTGGTRAIQLYKNSTGVKHSSAFSGTLVNSYPLYNSSGPLTSGFTIDDEVDFICIILDTNFTSPNNEILALDIVGTGVSTLDDNTVGGIVAPGAYASTHIPGKTFFSSYDHLDGKGRKSLSYGASPSDLSSPAIHPSYGLATEIHVPWYSNSSDLVAYFVKYAYNTSLRSVQRLNGTTAVDVTPTVGSARYTPRKSRCTIQSSVVNRNYLLIAGSDDTNDGIFLSRDGGYHYEVIYPPTDAAVRFTRATFSGDGLIIYLWGTEGVIAISQDMGRNLEDKSGNIADFTPGEILGIIGG